MTPHTTASQAVAGAMRQVAFGPVSDLRIPDHRER